MKKMWAFLVCLSLLGVVAMQAEADAAGKKIVVMWVGKSNRTTNVVMGFLPKLRDLALTWK
jgi:hypothetical protein